MAGSAQLPANRPKRSVGAWIGVGLALLFKLAAGAVAVATPVLGVWGASSLAAYLNGPVWAVVLAGLLLFPLLPVGWDVLGEWRRRRREQRQQQKQQHLGDVEPKPRILTLADRLILRTLALNLAFIAILLGTYPAKGFEALSTRGDWFLDGQDGELSNSVRSRLFWAAGKLEWLYDATRDNPFEQYAEDEPGQDGASLPEPGPLPVGTITVGPTPTAAGTGTASASPTPRPSSQPDGQEPEPPEPAPAGPSRERAWPLPARLHPAVVSMPAEAETSIASVASYLAEREPDPFFRVKALHDYVADRIAYDAPAYAEGHYPPQDAKTVFDRRVGVCAGYAKLLSALGRAADVRILYIVGDARTRGWDVSGEGHAWNAVEIDKQWYLIDATWDSGSVDGKTFKKSYRTDFLFTPPKAFGITHLPDEARWQLRENPLTRGEFMRQPVLAPAFYARGLALLAPTRSQVTVDGSLDVTVDNPSGLFMLGSFRPVGTSAEGTDCRVENGKKAQIHCEFPSDGRFEVLLFAHREEYGSYTYVGQLGANNDS